MTGNSGFWRRVAIWVYLMYSMVTGVYALPSENQQTLTSCQYSITLYDSFGDGWNGCTLDLMVDGAVVLDDITLTDGPGPAVFYFPVSTGSQITATFNAGSHPCEPYYYVYNSLGEQVFYAPDNCNPVIGPGQLFAGCPETGAVEGYVFNYSGLTVSGAVIGSEDGPFTVSGPDGYYFLSPVPAGQILLNCGKTGYNLVADTVTVVAGLTAPHNFTLTQPNIVVNPLSIDQTLNPNELFTTSLNILNNGSGLLEWNATVNYLSQPAQSCQYSIDLFDTYGDGWNGSVLDVLVNGEIVLNNITLNGGFGPTTYFFEVASGDEITTIFSPASWISEPFYYIYDSQGNEVWYSPASIHGPPNIQPGQLVAACGGANWLTLDSWTGIVNPFGGTNNVPTRLNASNTSAGETYSAEIVISSSPDVGTVQVPVTMLIAGNPLQPPENLEVQISDVVVGQANLTWEWTGDVFQFFMVKRDGVIIGTTTDEFYSDLLPAYGYYCYTVQAIFDEGASVPAGPVCVEWPDPDLLVEPDDLHGWVWTGFTVDVTTSVYNIGEGTLSFSFPEFAALRLINDDLIPGNLSGSPAASRIDETSKDDESLNGMGYPVILGAGGPDPFGYLWIDSDEPGGPQFNWVDISATGNVVNGLADDNIVGPFNIGFDFPYYGDAKSQFWLNANGTLGFTSNYISLGNISIPTNNAIYNDFVAWFWDDLVFRSGQSMVFYQNFPDKTIIQFNNYGRFGQTGGIWAQVILFKNGRLMLLYDRLDPAISLNSCSVGIQSGDPAVGLQVVYNNAYLHDDLAILISKPSDFIVDVEPAWGTVPSGDNRTITITYDSEGYEAGDYIQDLWLSSNDEDEPDWIIANTMHVYIPAQFAGTVIDMDGENPLPGVTVQAGNFQTLTDEIGNYRLYADEGEYDVVFSRPGYLDATVADTFALAGTVTPIDIGLWDANYSPAYVVATVEDEDTWCHVSWALPSGPYEIIFDDGGADDYFVYAHFGSWHAVKFTPSGYPATAIGGKFYTGDGSFPGPFLGTEFGVAIFDDDGPGGLPGTMLDSAGVTVNNYGWISMDWLNAVVEEGSFYLGMYQRFNTPNVAPIGIDLDNPTFYKSYSKVNTLPWQLSAYQDFMIRAWIIGPEGDMMTLATSPGNRDIQDYRIALYSDFDPDSSPSTGQMTELANTDELFYHDMAWDDLPDGWYAYGVKALYTSGLYSDYTVSNIVPHRLDCQVTVNVSLTTGLDPDQVEISLTGLDYPYQTYDDVTGSTGTITFDSVIIGNYNLEVFKVGYDPFMLASAPIENDTVLNIILGEKRYSPGCFDVDPLTLEAVWCKPLRTVLNEDFESPGFPPDGWQSVHEPQIPGWFRTLNGSVPGWTIPAWDSFYACSVGDQGSVISACCDYLITPPLDLRESEDFVLFFDSYYDGAFSQRAYVEYSFDNGSTWQVIHQMQPSDQWEKIAIDLSDFSGQNAEPKIWLAFNADWGGITSSGWAIDNPRVQVPMPAAGYIDFYVYLDDVFVGATSDTTWNFAPLTYGVEYTAAVAARYTSGLSPKVYDRFICQYLFPPRNLTGEAPDNTAFLQWDPPDNGMVSHLMNIPENLLGYNLYRDGAFILYQDHVGGDTVFLTQAAVEEDLDPGIYDYTVTGVYDLYSYGFPGQTGESMEEGPAIVTVDYCFDLEFKETWVHGNFEVNKWTAEGENWTVSGQPGNPPPAVKFSWDPVQSDYSFSLESYPLCAVGITEGQIWLDYDLKLDAFHTTGEERLFTEVWNWMDQTWIEVAEYTNEEGSFAWKSEHINIKSVALDNVFRIRYRAEGVNSLHIVGWNVDNIHIYRTCDAPVNLEATVNFEEAGIDVSWQIPATGDGMRDLQGVNIFRSKDGGDYEWIGFTPDMPYTDAPLANALWCYKASAVWAGETDTCISVISEEACEIMNVSAGNVPGELIEIHIYPNPATGRVRIDSPVELRHLRILNSTGQIVSDKDISGYCYELITTGYSEGIYLLRIETEAGNYSRTLAISL